MADNNFAHLHLHSEQSLLDGAIKIKDLAPHCKKLGLKACGISDHGVMSGVIEFYKECKKNEIKSIFGIEAYITADPDGLPKEKCTRDNHHCLLIAKDNIGYQKLLEVSSHAALHNFYYKPRITKENLRALRGHVIATTGCLGGWLPSLLNFRTDAQGRAAEVVDGNKRAELAFNYFLDIFGEDLYLELQVWDDGNRFQPVYNEWLLEFGDRRGLPFVITADAHYLAPEDVHLHEMLMAMQLGMTVEEYKNSGDLQYGPYFYVASPEEMLERARSINCEEAFYNVGKIVKQCNVDITLGEYEFPDYDITQEEDYDDFLVWKQQNCCSKHQQEQ